MARKKTWEEWVEDFTKVHGGRYEYRTGQVLSKGKDTKIKISCKEHGEFEQSVHNHKSGKGCPKCGKESRRKKRTKDKQYFLDTSIKVHGTKYDYSRVVYSTAMTKVEIVCEEHGSFWQTPNGHYQGRGCPECGNQKRWHTRGRLTTRDFVAKSKEVHGEKYEYRNVEYTSAKTKVEIVCEEHGSFWQTPNSHLGGKGCPKCGGTVKRTVEEFIQVAREIHGDAYDYRKVNYKNKESKVCIICPEHGEFYQRAGSHIRGQGCQKCAETKVGLSRRRNTEWFIEKSNEVHNGIYDYSRTEYVVSTQKVEIICPLHGPFMQTPSSHLSGNGCRICAAERIKSKLTKSKAEFIKGAVKVHGNLYDYSELEYQNDKEKVTIICSKHGGFQQAAGSHLAGNGCPKCAGMYCSTDDWISRFRDPHGDMYDYSLVEYVNSDVKIGITCEKHGIFYKRPIEHANGSGCPTCYNERRSSGEFWKPESAWGIAGYYGTDSPSNLYVLKLDDSFIKVGLAKEIHSRMNAINKESGYSVAKLYSVPGKANELFELEQKILRKSNLKRFYPEESFAGSTECLYLSELPKVLKIIKEWEEDKKSEEGA